MSVRSAPFPGRLDFRALDVWRRAQARLSPRHGTMIPVDPRGMATPVGLPRATADPLAAALAEDAAGLVAIDPAACDALLARAEGRPMAGQGEGGRCSPTAITRVIRADLLPPGPLINGEKFNAGCLIQDAGRHHDPDGVPPHVQTFIGHLRKQNAEVH